jgi:hypothetical protein
MEERAVFNCSYWSGMTIVHGNCSFFRILYDTLDTVCEYKDMSDQQYEVFAQKNQNSTSLKINYLKADLDCVTSTKENDYDSFDANCSDYLMIKFNSMFQLTISRIVAFEIGERVRVGLNKLQAISTENYKALYAFSRVVQNVSLGPKIRNID